FDRVISINVLYALDDPNAGLTELARVVKSDGTLVLVNPVKNPKIRDLLSAHLKAKKQKDNSIRVALFLLLHPRVTGLVLFNFFIIKTLARGKTFHFFFIDELETALNHAGWRLLHHSTAYGDTDLIVTAKRIFPYLAKNGQKFHVGFASTEEDYSNMYKLRYQIYCEELGSLATDS